MARKKNNLSNEQKEKREAELTDALKRLQIPIEDKRHGYTVVLENDMARSNQSRFQHITKESHDLLPGDIKTIEEKLPVNSKLKKDKTRRLTYNYYIKRNKSGAEYIKVSVQIDKIDKRLAKIKTIFITKAIK